MSRENNIGWLTDVPFSATVFFFTELIAASGITVLPPFNIGVTLTSSQSMGTLGNHLYALSRIQKCNTNLRSFVNILYGFTDFRANTWSTSILDESACSFEVRTIPRDQCNGVFALLTTVIIIHASLSVKLTLGPFFPANAAVGAEDACRWEPCQQFRMGCERRLLKLPPQHRPERDF